MNKTQVVEEIKCFINEEMVCESEFVATLSTLEIGNKKASNSYNNLDGMVNQYSLTVLNAIYTALKSYAWENIEEEIEEETPATEVFENNEVAATEETNKNERAVVKMAKQYTFNNLINGREYDNEKYEWVETDLFERQDKLSQFKFFLLQYTRNGSKANIAIQNMDVVRSLPKTCGIFDRLVIGERGVEYIAGQDYTAEMNIIKQIIIKECY